MPRYSEEILKIGDERVALKVCISKLHRSFTIWNDQFYITKNSFILTNYSMPLPTAKNLKW